ALEDQGFQFEGAEASFELLMERALGRHKPYFELDAYRVIVEEQNRDAEPVAEATVRVRVKGILEHTAASGNGPVNALDHALRKALEEFYPSLQAMRLLDYKVRILDESKGTAAKTRVLITSGAAAADLLVVDYLMPELNGFEFIQEAWSLRPTLRVVMITAHGTRELLGEASQAGIHGMVLKPFTPSDLTRGVQAAMERSSPA